MTTGKRTEIIKAHFEGEAGAYDGNVVKTVPHYEEMLDAVASAFPFRPDADIKIVDLGSGTGNLSLALRKRFPNARVSCMDISGKMLETARKKLGESRTDYILADFSGHEFSMKCDAVVSSLALHHLERKARRQFFARVYGALNEGGVFVNADIVLASNSRWQRMYLAKWEGFLAPSLPREKIEEAYARYRSEDRPVPLLGDIQLLRDVGFREADVFWKYYNFAVYGAIK